MSREMPTDVNVTEKVARWLFAALAQRGVWEAEPQPVRVGYEAEARHLLTTVLADPEVLAGIAGVLRQAFADSTCGGHLDLAGDVADWMPEATAVVEWLRGRA